METSIIKDQIFNQRREMKEKSHAVVRSHYFVLFILSLVLVLFGTEFSTTLSGWENRSTKSADDPGNILSADDILTSDTVFSSILSGNLDESLMQADTLQKKMKEDDSSLILGRTRGVLAQVVNSLGSGMLFAKMAQSIRTITHSREAAVILFVIFAFLWYMVVFTFVKNLYSAAIRRIYLEARIYEKISFLDIAYFRSVRKWLHASWIMLFTYVIYTLWTLTIVGGIIKYFSYWAVPYIVAENPAMPAKKAITLSRKMMMGHKWELFKYQVTYIGWILLGIVTFGVSDIVYGVPYRMAGYAEFYARIREQAKESRIEGSEDLQDVYLFEKADRIRLYETYFEVVDEITVLHENKITLTGWQRKISEWFGIWIGSLKQKKAYENQEGRLFTVEHYRASMLGKAYPLWLCPLWKKKEMESRGDFTYLRSYTVWSLILLFITFSFAGWVWEVTLHLIQSGEFANRGTLHGPWLPIYGTGGVIVLILCSRFRKKPVLEFITAIVLCGILEYFSGWFLEMKYHQRWWSYDGYFLNLHGRICAEGLLVFGVGCCAVVYLLAPAFDYYLSKLKGSIVIGLAAVLGTAFAADYVYSSSHPNMAKGAVETIAQTEEQTEELTEE